MANVKEKKEVDIERLVLNIQRFSFYIFLAIFIGLILINIYYPPIQNADATTRTFLPIVTGWIGVILGFYFSREIGSLITQRWKDLRRKRDAEIKEAKKLVKEIEEERKIEIKELKEEFEKRIRTRNVRIDRLRTLLIRERTQRRKKRKR